MKNSSETSNYKEEEPKRYSQCESGLHIEEIPPGSLLDMAWEKQQEKGQLGNLIIPTVSCPHCTPEI